MVEDVICLGASTDTVSVVIRTFNSGKTLLRCLESLGLQDLKFLEIVVIDSGSTDETCEIARGFGCNVIFYPIEEVPFNYSKSLNMAIARTRGDHVLIISSHVWLVNRKGVRLMLAKLTGDVKVKAVSLYRSKEPESSGVVDPVGVLIDRSNFKGEGMYNYCSMIRKSDWSMRPFREDIPTCEDQEWIWYWLRTGNWSSYLFEYPLAGYNNPNYNLAKDVQEMYICGKYVYPKYLSFGHLLNLYAMSIRFLLEKRIGKGRHYFLLASTLLRYKFIPPPSIQSDSYLKSKGK